MYDNIFILLCCLWVYSFCWVLACGCVESKFYNFWLAVVFFVFFLRLDSHSQLQMWTWEHPKFIWSAFMYVAHLSLKLNLSFSCHLNDNMIFKILILNTTLIVLDKIFLKCYLFPFTYIWKLPLRLQKCLFAMNHNMLSKLECTLFITKLI